MSLYFAVNIAVILSSTSSVAIATQIIKVSNDIMTVVNFQASKAFSATEWFSFQYIYHEYY